MSILRSTELLTSWFQKICFDFLCYETWKQVFPGQAETFDCMINGLKCLTAAAMRSVSASHGNHVT